MRQLTCVCLRGLLLIFVAVNGSAAAQTGDPDTQALQELNGFLNDPAARHAFAAGKPDAQQTNTFLETFPKWAQDELMSIVMDIMRESKAGATKHVDAYKSGGAAGAKASFSPAVQRRVEALESRLGADPAFSGAGNMAKMKNFIPAFLGAPGS